MPKNASKKPEASKESQQFYEAFNTYWSILDRPEPYLDNKSPRQYWDECRARFNLLSSFNKSYKDWHSTYDTGLPRNKTLALFAHSVGQNFQPSIVAQNRHQMIDKTLSMFAKDIVDQSLDKEKWDVKRFWQQLTTFVEGTSIMEECYGAFKQKSKNIIDIDHETGEAKVEEVETEVYRGAYFHLLPNDHVLVPNPYIRDIQDQDEVFIYYRLSSDKFKSIFGRYPNADKVQPGLVTGWQEESSIFDRYQDITKLTENEVMVIKRFRKSDDTLTIYANGQCLTRANNPIPRPVSETRAKRYPLIFEMAEPIDNDFLYGKSIVDRLAKVADDLNTLWRIMIDREVLKNVPPIETTNEALLNEDLVIPGNVIHKAREQDTTQVVPGLFAAMDQGLPNLIQMLEREADNDSLSQLQSGQSPSGGQPTATQTLAMAKNAQTMLNMFNELQRHSVAAMTEMRLDTLFWRIKIDKDYKEELPLITVHDKVLTSGKTGSRSYALTKGLKDADEKEKMSLSKKMYKLEEEMKGVIEYAAIDVDEALDFDYYVKVDAEPAPRKNTDLEKMLAMEKFSFYSQRPDLFNLEPAATDVALVLGDDPDEVVMKKGADQSLPPAENPLSPDLKALMGAPQNQPLANVAPMVS
jgi:hypothetical protein